MMDVVRRSQEWEKEGDLYIPCPAKRKTGKERENDERDKARSGQGRRNERRKGARKGKNKGTKEPEAEPKARTNRELPDLTK